MSTRIRTVLFLACAAAATACASSTPRPQTAATPTPAAASAAVQPEAPAPAPPTPVRPTVADAQKFMDEAEAKLMDLSIEAGRASWVQSNFITFDTQILSAASNDRAIAAQTELAGEAQKFTGLALPPDLERRMNVLKVGLTMAGT